VKINRRTLLGGTAAATLGACIQQNSQAEKIHTFVLIHGTWHGEWVWKYVREYLQVRGHAVFTPTLTGCGDREHLSSPTVGLETHIQDIVNLLEFEDLKNVFISAHSFSGVAMTGAVDRTKDRIAHVNFFDALVPYGDRLSGVEYDSTGQPGEYFRARQPGFIDGYKMVFEKDYPFKMLMPEAHPKADWVKSKLTTHPAKSWTDVLSLKNDGWNGLSRSYIHCAGQKFAPSSDKMVGPARGEGWNYLELDIARNGMVTNPEILAKTYLKLAGDVI